MALAILKNTIFSQKNNDLTLISPPSFPLNCDIINIHEHNLHMIIIFIFYLFLDKDRPFLFAMISDLPWFIFVLAFRYVIDYTYLEEIWGVGLIRVKYFLWEIPFLKCMLLYTLPYSFQVMTKTIFTKSYQMARVAPSFRKFSKDLSFRSVQVHKTVKVVQITLEKIYYIG